MTTVFSLDTDKSIQFHSGMQNFPFLSTITLPARLAVFGLLGALALAAPQAAEAIDSLDAGQSTLTGELVDIVDDKANFAIDGTDSSVAVATDELKNLTTTEPRLIIFGEHESVLGRLDGIREGNLEIRTEDGRSVQVPLSEIVSLGSPAAGEFDQWTRDNLRFWSGSLDLSASTSQATTDTTQILFGAAAQRDSEKSQLKVGVSYRYGTQKEDNAPKQTNLDEAVGTLNLRYTVWDHIFVFGDMAATYNAIQKLSLRAQPSAGAGWDFIDNDQGRVSAKAGFGWVFESYFGGDENEYAALALGLDTQWDLPLDSTLTAELNYLPALNAFADNYLLQARVSYTVPVISILNFKVQITDDYNNRPAAGTQPNSFYFNVGLSVSL